MRKKKQHLVPQSYLRRFADERGRLFVYDKVLRSRYSNTVRNVAQENGFYDLPREAFPPGAEGDAVNLQAVEDVLSIYEGQFAETCAGLIDDVEAKGIGPEQKRVMALFIAIQLLRTREARDMIVEFWNKAGQVITDVFAEARFPDAPPDLYPRFSLDKNTESLWHTQFMLDENTLRAMSVTLLGHIWQIGVNDTDHSFYTSDHPVVKHAHLRHPLKSMAGIGSPGIEVAFPLTPRYILTLAERTTFRSLEPQDGKALLLTADNVTWYNDLQVSGSYRQIFCPIDNFALAEEICRQRPEVCNPSRERVLVNPYHPPKK